MQAELLRYQAGEISFNQFARLTHKTWHSLAQHLLNRWKASPAVSPDDLQQELLLACWRCIPKFDPARKVSLVRFVVYNCCDKAKKWLHKQRNAYRRDDKAPSRFPVALASLGLEEHAEERLMSGVSTEAIQETEMVRRQALLRVEFDDLAFMHYQMTGSIELAARNIHANPMHRLLLRAGSIDTARAVVERSIERAVEAAAVSAA